ncbi:MAG: hypothetical protein GY832_12295 [Chloroflexi bacterium]|nr:hypothetical protein [Chloroflexota bacterium]
MKKRLFFGTINQAKLDYFRELFEPLPVEISSPRDLNINLDVKEDGESAQENAEKKARAYFAESNIPTLAVDGGLHIAKFPDEKQPGLYVKRIHRTDQDASDQEILDYYVKELRKVGGKSAGTWQVSIVLMVSENRIFSQNYSLETVFTAQAKGAVTSGVPLNSLMIDPASEKYYSEMTWTDRPDARWILEFVEQHIDEL